MYFLELSLNSSRVIFSTMTNSQISHYIMSFYSDEEKESFESDLQECYNKAWIHPYFDVEYYANLGKQPIRVNSETNTLTATFIIHNIDGVCESLFDPPKIGFNPVKNFIDANPDEGTCSMKLFDSNGNDLTDQYSYV